MIEEKMSSNQEKIYKTNAKRDESFQFLWKAVALRTLLDGQRDLKKEYRQLLKMNRSHEIDAKINTAMDYFYSADWQIICTYAGIRMKPSAIKMYISPTNKKIINSPRQDDAESMEYTKINN